MSMEFRLPLPLAFPSLLFFFHVQVALDWTVCLLPDSKEKGQHLPSSANSGPREENHSLFLPAGMIFY